MKMLVDQWSLINILYYKTFKIVHLLQSIIQLYDNQIVNFFRERINTQGYMDLYTKFKELNTDNHIKV